MLVQGFLHGYQNHPRYVAILPLGAGLKSYCVIFLSPWAVAVFQAYDDDDDDDSPLSYTDNWERSFNKAKKR